MLVSDYICQKLKLHYFFGTIDKEKNIAWLENEEAHHCAVVLRMNVDDVIGILNSSENKEAILKARLVSVHKRQCVAEIIEQQLFQPPVFKSHLVISPPKNNERLEWIVEKAVELRVSSLLFVKSDRCIRKSLNLERLKNISLSAAKQSANPVLLKLEMQNDINYLKNEILTDDAVYLLLHCYPASKINLSLELLENIQKLGKKNIYVFIGPEGDWTEEEVNWIKQHFQPLLEINLGKTRLRTETAAIQIASVLSILNSSISE